MYLPIGPPKGAALTINRDRSTASCHSILYSSTFLLKKNTFCDGNFCCNSIMAIGCTFNIFIGCTFNIFDRRGLNPRPPDLEFKVLTVPSDTPPKWKRMHRNQAKKQSDGLAVLVLKTKSKIMVEDFLCYG